MTRFFSPSAVTALMALLLLPLGLSGQETNWQTDLQDRLDLMGHRNWILVVDKAFPEQSAAGITTLYTDQELVPVLETVLRMVESTTHVRPVIFRDQELRYLDDGLVNGIETFKEQAGQVLAGYPVQSLLHEEVFRLLDEGSALFTTLVIKTGCTLPYTSVFMQLDCAYWGPEQEKELRERMKTGSGSPAEENR